MNAPDDTLDVGQVRDHLKAAENRIAEVLSRLEGQLGSNITVRVEIATTDASTFSGRRTIYNVNLTAEVHP